jgi:hypothetical protein
MKLSCRVVLLTLCLTGLAALVLGQQTLTNGNVTGTVTDATGAAVPDAMVTLASTSTSTVLTTHTNSAGLYLFQNVEVGVYTLSVTKQGFEKSVVANQQVTTGTNLTLNVTLQVGSTTQVVEVTEVAGAELQTESATMGTSLGGNAILQLPTIARDTSALVFFEPTAAPTFNGAEDNITSGNIAGALADQNTFLLDGGYNTSDLDGDNATYVNHNGQGVMPTPAESVEEFRVNTNNMTSDFGSSQGGEILITTKHGTNSFHGSAYDFFQGDWLNSNDWKNNLDGIAKPKAHFNRFGGALGGPMAPSFLGGKTYFYANYEGERYPRSGPYEALVPSTTLREGVIQERDANGNIVQYNLATSTNCGASGGLPCDPLHTGINPVVSQIWNKYMPACNDLNYGDHGLNTCGFIGNLNFPLSNDFGVIRIDHDFGSNWRFFSSYRYYRQDNPTEDQVDIGGLLPGDKFGQPASASTNIYQPRFIVAGLTGTISPTLTNDFHFTYLRDQWQWIRAAAGIPQVAGLGAPVTIGGDNTHASALVPLNINTQSARPRLWDSHDYDFRDNVSWVKGTHLFQFGGDFLDQYWKFDRYDNVVGGLTQLIYEIGGSNNGINMTPNFQPIPCGGGLTANCLPSSELGGTNGWNALYSDVLGLVDSATVVATRTGANLSLNPLGTPLHSDVSAPMASMFINDTWKLKPNFTLTWGVSYQLQMPPTDAHGVQDIMVYASNNQPVYLQNYLDAQRVTAENGYISNPTLAFSPIGDVKGLNYPYHPFYGGISPRVSIAWTPNASGGFWGWLLGDKATVIRGGYGRFYAHNLGIDLVSTPVLGDGFLQPVTCSDPTAAGACTSAQGADPSTAFRIGVNGLTAPLPAISPTLSAPVVPGVTAPSAALLESLDGNFRPSVSDQVDFSIQRQFKGNVILELGYVGMWARDIYLGVEFSDVPWMMKLKGQSFANAYDNLYFELAGGKPVLPQPFFEAALKGSSYCAGYSSCTAAVAANESSNILGQYVGSMWADLDSSYYFGPSNPIDAGQCTLFCYATTSWGWSNYNAGIVSLTKRSTNLTVNANFTYGHALGTTGLNQAYTFASTNDPWNPGVDYGPQYFDRKFTANFLASYNLPFGKGQRWSSSHAAINEILGGWIISPIFSYGSGLPLMVYTGSFQEWGTGVSGDTDGCTAVPINPNMGYSNSAVYGVVGSNGIGINGDPANGGNAVNLFGNPAAVYNNFRPNLVGIDGRCGGGGTLRGQQRWNLDLGLTKQFTFTERAGLQIFAQAFNVLNHMEWGDPGGQVGGAPALNLQDPQDFGVLNSQYNALALGAGAGAEGANYTRIIQLGLRLYF